MGSPKKTTETVTETKQAIEVPRELIVKQDIVDGMLGVTQTTVITEDEAKKLIEEAKAGKVKATGNIIKGLKTIKAGEPITNIETVLEAKGLLARHLVAIN